MRDFQGYYYIAYCKDLANRIYKEQHPDGATGGINLTNLKEEIEESM